MRILLTGGAGFIGSHVAESLLERGCELAIVDNLDPFYSPDIKRANLSEVSRVGDYGFFNADIRDFDQLSKIFSEFRPTIVIHLAARAGVRPSIEDPRGYEVTNVGGTQNILELCRVFNVERLVFGSSSSVYGDSTHAPFSEDQVDLRPISPYAATKLAGELLCHVYSHVHRLPVICLRFFTVYGPRQRPDLAIHKFTSLIEAGEPVPVFGDESTGRDYTWYEDIVAGILTSTKISLPPDETPFRIYNLGNSHPVKLHDLISAIELATGRQAKRLRMPAQPGDVALTWADISKARRDLKYDPKTMLATGLAKFVEWFRRTGNSRAASAH
jgi:UDP-glucuronate 4-epimerase